MAMKRTLDKTYLTFFNRHCGYWLSFTFIRRGQDGQFQRRCHYNDVIMGAIASQVTSLTSLLNRLFRRRSKKTSKLRVTGLCAGNSPITGEFPARTRKMFSFDFAIMIYGTGIWMHDSFTSRILWTIGTSGRFCLSHQMSDINNSLRSTIIRSIELESVFPFHEKYRIDNVYIYVSIRFTMVVI